MQLTMSKNHSRMSDFLCLLGHIRSFMSIDNPTSSSSTNRSFDL